MLWEIHRPLRGWYIRLRSPRFPQNVFIPLVPVTPSSPYHLPGSLKFSCRTNVVPASHPNIPLSIPSPSPRLPASSHSSTDSDVTLTDVPNGQLSPTHTYPPAPTPPRAVVSPPSPSAVHAKLDQLTQPQVIVSQFILLPHTHAAAAAPASEGLVSRALRALKNSAPAHSNSFTLCPLPDDPPPTPEVTHHHHHSHLSRGAFGLAHLLTFEDTTPVFSVGSSTGVFEIHLDQIERLGLDLAFWIAVALAYGEFVGDREVSFILLYLINRMAETTSQGYLAAVAD